MLFSNSGSFDFVRLLHGIRFHDKLWDNDSAAGVFGDFGNHKYVCRFTFPRESVLHGGGDAIRILPDSRHTDDNGRQKCGIVNR